MPTVSAALHSKSHHTTGKHDFFTEQFVNISKEITVVLRSGFTLLCHFSTYPVFQSTKGHIQV